MTWFLGALNACTSQCSCTCKWMKLDQDSWHLYNISEYFFCVFVYSVCAGTYVSLISDQFASIPPITTKWTLECTCCAWPYSFGCFPPVRCSRLKGYFDWLPLYVYRVTVWRLHLQKQKRIEREGMEKEVYFFWNDLQTYLHTFTRCISSPEFLSVILPLNSPVTVKRLILNTIYFILSHLNRLILSLSFAQHWRLPVPQIYYSINPL